MTKVPYMPFYPEKYLADDRLAHFTIEQHGAYMLLLMHMWNRGGQLPDNDVYLAGLVKVTGRKWKALRGVLIHQTTISTNSKSLTNQHMTDSKALTQLQPMISYIDESTGDRFITQSKLLSEYEKTVSLIEKKREGGRKGGLSPQAHLKDSSSTPQAHLKESLSTPQGVLKHTSSNKELDLDKDKDKEKNKTLEFLSETPEAQASPASVEGQASLRESSPSEVDDTGREVSPKAKTVREITALYRNLIPQNLHSEKDWSYLGGLVRRNGIEAVMHGIHSLSDALARQQIIEKPGPYVGTVARRYRDGPITPLPRTPKAIDTVPPAWHVIRNFLENHGEENSHDSS